MSHWSQPANTKEQWLFGTGQLSIGEKFAACGMLYVSAQNLSMIPCGSLYELCWKDLDF